ncbi:Brefeldin A-inhibited guanine nucleotide-exchange protein 1 [Dermatophagoides pteronyssinus]|uniref:Brefeldin A-inhibited guanine nucleotide-exchange protein 1 n=1 Tax=Dermatophagoides pteronyssinus TaxID=6956 RepID=A0ABQ8J1M4_DERPT|nr:Brefeldin A-inhibited guanine nucleotide-exchange protein 1 [Dermatophagoides pteronyssinus]
MFENCSFKTEKIMFICRALEKILADRDIRKNHNQKLKKSCEIVLEKIKNDQIKTSNSSNHQQQINHQQQSNEHNHQHSSTLPQPSNRKGQSVFDDEIYFRPFELACQSRSNRIIIIALDCIQKLIAYGHFTGNRIDNRSNTDDMMMVLQIIKALLTIVTSQSCPVHEQSILLVIRTCYNIYLSSKKLVNQTTAKAALTQMLNVIFSRMESISSSSATSTTSSFGNSGEISHQNNNCDNNSLDTNPESSNELFDIYYQISEQNPSNSIKSLVDDVVTTNLTNISSFETSFETNDTIHLSFENLYQKDAYLIFRSLCKLSMKPLMDMNNSLDLKSHELRSKILSLQLILQILQNSGPIFQQSDMFAVAIKQYLCVALSKNGVSNVMEIFELSLAIFLALFQKFKIYLKMQIEVFFKEIFLNILETISSSFEHKWMVIQALTRICADAQSIVDIYVNYDCDLSSENIFGRLVNDLSKIAQGGGQILDSGIVNQTQERSMRIKGLECLVSILKCMVEWSNDLYVNPNQQTDLVNEKSMIRGLKTEDQQQQSLHETSSFNNLDDNPEKFEEVKNQKNIIDKGIDLFNMNAGKGIKYLQHHNIIDSQPESVAQFFHQNDRLDKSNMGEFMGDFNQFNKEVMYAYVDQMDFSRRDIVSALRFFLEGFRLPGEAQKIDRFMEKFASRYFQTNRNHNLFTSADTVYVLAYSIIMLTTDLHSPQVKRKMTKDDYIKLNRGINESKDLPEEYLSQIYDEIAESEIKMKGVAGLKKVSGKELTSEKARRLLYNMEMETMATTAKALMESVSHVESPFTSAKHLEHVRPMFRTTWTSFLAAFSVGLQDCDDDQAIASHCLNGIRCAIRIACIFQMSLERDAFVQALSRFTLLNANVPIIEMKTKNIDTIKTLITVAYTDGNYLGKSWLDILRCISQLELAQLIGTKGGQMLPNQNGGNSFGFQFKLESFVALESLARNREKESRISESMIEASSQSVIVAVDRIFTGSIHLDGNAIVDFVKALCQVSSEELSNQKNPRMFSLQKIVEISCYNMSRIRLQWSRIWEILGEHFNKVGCNPNEEIAFFAIDSLRQLSMKFIEKGELSNFSFQKDFLRPFEHIMKCNSSITIRDMVVRCIAQMVNSQASNIKSGWKNIFSVFRIAASETDSYIFDLSFQTTCNIFNNIYERNFTAMIDSFQDAIKCLSEFGCNQHFPDTSMESIRLIRACARYVAEQPQYFKEFNNLDDKQTSSTSNGFLASEDDRVWIRGWLPILFELSCIVNQCKLDVRTRALTVMFEIIKSHGNVFRENWWTDLFKIIFRIFDSLKLPGSHSDRIEWMTTTCNHALYSIVDVFTQYFDLLGSFLLKDVYSQLFWCIQQDNEQLSRSGINCFENLIISCGRKYNLNTWSMTLEFIERIHDATKPLQLFDSDSANANHVNHVNHKQQQRQKSILTDEELELIKIKFLIQLDLIQAIDNIVFYPSFSKNFDSEMLKYLENCSKFIDLDKQKNQTSNVNDDDDDYCETTAISTNNGPLCYSNDNNIVISNIITNGMYTQMTTTILLRLSRFLLKIFNQFNQLYLDKTKSKLLADKLILLSQLEIKSLLCSLRILFYLYNDLDRQQQQQQPEQQEFIGQIEQELISISSRALNYYYHIENEYNRDNWTIIILLILYNVSCLPSGKFYKHIRYYYKLICNLLLLDLKMTVKILIRKIFLRLELDQFNSTTTTIDNRQ